MLAFTVLAASLLTQPANSPGGSPAAAPKSAPTSGLYTATPLSPVTKNGLKRSTQIIDRTFPDGTVFGQSIYSPASPGSPSEFSTWIYKGGHTPLVTVGPDGKTPGGGSMHSVNASGQAAGVGFKQVWVWTKGTLKWFAPTPPAGFENLKVSYDQIQIFDSGVIAGVGTFEGTNGSIAWTSDGTNHTWVGLSYAPFVDRDKTLISRVIDVRPDGTVVGVSIAPGPATRNIPRGPLSGRSAVGVCWILQNGRYTEYFPSNSKRASAPLASPLGMLKDDLALVRIGSGVGVASREGRITPLSFADGFENPTFDLGVVSRDGKRFVVAASAGTGQADSDEKDRTRHWLFTGLRPVELRIPLQSVIGGVSLLVSPRVILDSGVVLGSVSRREVTPINDGTYFDVAVKWVNGAPSPILPPDATPKTFQASVLHFDQPAGDRFIVGDRFVSSDPQTTTTILTNPRTAWIYDIQKDTSSNIADPAHPEWSIRPLAVSSNGTAFLHITDARQPASAPQFYTWSKATGFSPLVIQQGSKPVTPEVLRIQTILDADAKRFIASFVPQPPPTQRSQLVNDRPYRRILHSLPSNDQFLLEG